MGRKLSKNCWVLILLVSVTLCALSVMFLHNQAQFSKFKQDLSVYQNREELLPIKQEIIKLNAQADDYSKLLIKSDKSLGEMRQRLDRTPTALEVENLQHENQKQLKALLAFEEQLEFLQANVNEWHKLVLQTAPASKPFAKKNKNSPSAQAEKILTKKPVAPFVLLGVEHRGKRAFAAVAPQKYTRLNQVTLLSEGETLFHWHLLSTSNNKARFRVNGQIQTLQIY